MFEWDDALHPVMVDDWGYRLYMGLLLTVMYTIIKAKLSIFYGINFVKTDNGITIYIMGLVAATTALS